MLGLLALRLLGLGLRPVVEAGNAGLDFFEQLVVGGDLPVDFSLAVRMPRFSIWLAAGPQWTEGILSMPRRL